MFTELQQSTNQWIANSPSIYFFCSVIDTCEKYSGGSAQKLLHKEKYAEKQIEEVGRKKCGSSKDVKDSAVKRTSSSRESPGHRRKSEMNEPPIVDTKRHKLDNELKETTDVCDSGECSRHIKYCLIGFQLTIPWVTTIAFSIFFS